MRRSWCARLTVLSVLALVGLVRMAPVMGQDKKEADDLPPPLAPSAIVIFAEEAEAKEIADLDPELLKQLTAASRGGKSVFPPAILKNYDTLLARSPSPSAAMNKSVVTYCGSRVGSQVGNGQCAVLLDSALKALNGRRYTPYGPDADYVWGNLVATIRKGQATGSSNIQPGDMLQFRDAKFAGKYTEPSGRWWTWRYSAGHHSAVVAAVSPDRRVLKVYESNINGNLRTQYGYYVPGDMTGGWVKAYRPVRRS